MDKFIRTVRWTKGPKVIGPYSVGKIYNGVAYISGQLGFDPLTSKLVSDSVEDQTHQIMKNIKSILAQANSSMQNILKCTVYLTDMNDFPKMNGVYAGYFKEEPPARVCIAVKELPAKGKVQIDVIAAINAASKL